MSPGLGVRGKGVQGLRAPMTAQPAACSSRGPNKRLRPPIASTLRCHEGALDINAATALRRSNNDGDVKLAPVAG